MRQHLQLQPVAAFSSAGSCSVLLRSSCSVQLRWQQQPQRPVALEEELQRPAVSCGCSVPLPQQEQQHHQLQRPTPTAAAVATGFCCAGSRSCSVLQLQRPDAQAAAIAASCPDSSSQQQLQDPAAAVVAVPGRQQELQRPVTPATVAAPCSTSSVCSVQLRELDQSQHVTAQRKRQQQLRAVAASCCGSSSSCSVLLRQQQL